MSEKIVPMTLMPVPRVLETGRYYWVTFTRDDWSGNEVRLLKLESLERVGDGFKPVWMMPHGSPTLPGNVTQVSVEDVD